MRWTSIAPASGKFEASSDASVLAGENSDRLIWLLLPISMASAMVSPSARPKPSTRAARMPDDAVGSMTFSIASQRVVPMPKAASLTLYGMRRKASAEMAATVGRIMIASTRAAGAMPGPLRSVPKNGNPAQVFVQPIRPGPDQRDQHIDAPQTEDDRGDGRQHLHDGAEHRGQPSRDETLGEKNGNGDAEETAQKQRQQRTVQGTPDLGEHAELRPVDIPGAAGDEAEAVVSDRGPGLAAEFPENEADQRNDQQCARVGNSAENRITQVIGGRRRSRNGATLASAENLL